MSDVIAQAARRWIGTPYQHQQSQCGVGTDCLGLIRGMWREVIGPEPEVVPHYSHDWGEAGAEEILHLATLRHLVANRWLTRQSGMFFCFVCAGASLPSI